MTHDPDDDHDQRFKTLLQEFLPEFIGCFFPHWFDRFDFAHIDWLEQDAFLDPPDGEHKIFDLVAQVRTVEPVEPGKSDCLVLIHIEVESSDSGANLRRRMLQYYAYLRRSRAMPVFPIGLFLRVSGNGIGHDTYEEKLWGCTLIRFDYFTIGLPALDGLAYAHGTNVLGVALSSLMQLPKADRARFLSDGLDRIMNTGENDMRKFLLAECLDNYTIMSEPERETFEKLQEEKRPMEKEFVSSFERRGIKKGIALGEATGIALGEATGIALGEARGETVGQRKVVLRLLNKKFGELSVDQKSTIEALSVEQLEEISLAILDASSLSELPGFDK